MPERIPARGRTITLTLLFAIGVIAVLGARHDMAKADLRTRQDLPPDVRTEVDETWGRFVGVFERHRRCVGDADLVLVRSLEEGDARYVPAESLIEIKIPTSPRRFRESLVHELAHHVEHTCDAHEDLRARLGFDDDSWATGTQWELIPAERWAEAVVQLVNGERVRHGRTMPLEAAWIAEIESWIEGG